jgi:hypothetical protein
VPVPGSFDLCQRRRNAFLIAWLPVYITADATMGIDADELVRLCARAKSRGQVPPAPAADPEEVSSLATELSNLFWAMDLLDDDTSERAVWLQRSTETIPHADLADGFMRMARAANPLSPHVCSGVIAEVFQRKLQTYRSRSARRLVGKKKPLAPHLKWHQLTHDERSNIRRLASDLAVYHRGFVRPHRPRKDRLDTLLWQLADLYARYAGWRENLLFLASAERSLFIQFCHVALRPLSGRDATFAISEVSVQALSRRWNRLLQKARENPPAFRPRRRGASLTIPGSRRKPQ